MNAQLKPADNPAAPQALAATLARLRAAQQARTPDLAQRLDDLARLRDRFTQRLPALAAAMSADFGRRSRHESLLADGMTVVKEIDHTRSHLRRFMKSRGGMADWQFWPARIEVRHQPLGVVGIISPWNYPVSMALMPLVAAIGAGNHVMVKPSEHTPRTSELLAEVLAEAFPADRVATVLGDASVAAAFAALPFDHLLFTGSTEVGRKVMAAAAANLTPVTLELGGKSPVIIAPDFPLRTATQRIAFGKFLNAGQTCVAPDYVLLPRARIPEFVEYMREYVGAAYPDVAASPDYTSIVNERQFARLAKWVEEARARGATVVELGTHDPARRLFAPTLVLDAPEDLALMREEVFGPVLVLVACESIDAAIDYVNARPRPLALYHFDHDRARTRRVLDGTISGGVTINDVVLHFAQSELPIGGVGPSGMGQYHGRDGFLTFSKQKPVMYQSRWSSMALFRPPYGKLADFLVRFLTR